jgi:hypothetical protein
MSYRFGHFDRLISSPVASDLYSEAIAISTWVTKITEVRRAGKEYCDRYS